MSQKPHDFFSPEAAKHYDERNANLAPITDAVQFLISLALKDLPSQAHVLCSGAGTGAEILYLAKKFPHWTFVALDPSASMLDICRERLERAGLSDRCTLVHGYVSDLPELPSFDAALSVLVGHFVERQNRVSYYSGMAKRLHSGGILVNTEICFDLDSPEFAPMLKNWESVQTLMGATAASLTSLPQVLRETLTILPPSETETLLRQSGIAVPVPFFRAFMIAGWHGRV